MNIPAPPAPGFNSIPSSAPPPNTATGPLVVVAGAGTGKTRVITERIRYLLDTQPELTGKEILGLTFTDKAAAEMKHRVVAAARDRGESDAERAEAVTLSTFHSFCNSLLQEIDPDLKPIDKIDHWILLRRNLPLLQLEHYRRLAEPGQFLGDFVQFFSRCQDELVTPDDYQRYAARQAEELSARFAARCPMTSAASARKKSPSFRKSRALTAPAICFCANAS